MSDRDDEGHGRFVPHPSDEEFHTYDATDEEEERGRGPLLLAGIILLLAAFGGVLFFAYQQGVKEGMRSAPPLIRAEQGPAKVTPQDPGGMEIPHQDKRIYDRIAGAESEEEGVERLLPRAEEPMKLPNGDTEEKPAAEKETAAEPTSPEEAVIPGAAPRTPEAKPSQSASKPAPAASSSSSSGKYVVQIAALRSEADAKSRFASLQKQHGDLLSGTEADIQRADLGDKGVYYRLRIGYLDSKSSADSLCSKLKSRGLDCLVRER
jgi:cell division protein FtsN